MKERITTYILAAMMLLTACTDDEFIGGGSVGDDSVIGFTPGVEAVTRATSTGKDAAAKLGGAFYVYGIKNEVLGQVDAENLVFDNYKVVYEDGSSNSTESNSSGWEYVGLNLSANEAANIKDNSGTGLQKIKYWDYKASNYTYYAFSAKSDDIENGYVQVEKTTNSTASVYDNGYKVTLTADADPTKLYFSNRQSIRQSDNTVQTKANAYGGKVQFSFHNAMAKVRVGMYETIPGYTVTLDGFKVADDANPTFGDMTTLETGKFAANIVNNKTGKGGTMTVTYKNSGATEDNPVISFDATKDNILYLGDHLSADKDLETTATAAVYDTNGGGYTTVYPMENNKNNLKLKVNFTLKSKVGETIKVTDATAEVPAQYLQWKPGYAYTYLFKISDQVNATIGSLTGLYPITFDAVVINDGTGEDELISTTTVGNYNIITIGYDNASSKVTVGKDDYDAGNTLYATVVDNDNVATQQQITDNAKLYVVTTSDHENYPITEQSVEDYLGKTNYASLVDQPVTAYDVTADLAKVVTTIPKGDGTASTNNLPALQWTATKNVYAVEYSVTSSNKKYYKIVRVGSFNGEFEWSFNLKVSGSTSDTSEIGNVGGTLIPTLVIGDETIDNANVTYEVDSSLSSYINVESDKTITVKGGTPAGKYTVTAKYNRRTYTTTFTVNT
jgi:hypothetical protein